MLDSAAHSNSPVVLLVLDGWGLAPAGTGNVITEKTAPNMFSLIQEYPSTKLAAAGEAVGLPPGEDGNSEVGHWNLGAGRIVVQSQPRINLSIVDGSFFNNKAFLAAVKQVKEKKGSLHLMGLIGSGQVHAYYEHLLALLYLAKKNEIERVYLHLFTDGRDSSPNGALPMIKRLEDELRRLGIGKIVTIMGRYFAMDRDLRWERTKMAYEALTEADGVIAADPISAIEESYKLGVTDEFIKPVQVGDNRAETRIKEGDSVIFFNFRVDRPRQLTKAFVMPDFETTAMVIRGFDPYETEVHQKHIHATPFNTPFQRKIKLNDLVFVTMTEYESGLPVEEAFPITPVGQNLSEVVSLAGLKQLKIAETEKERFVTHCINCGKDNAYPGEDRLIVPSPNVATYDLQPEMATPSIVQAVVGKLGRNNYSLFVVNIACPDMVAHTGNIEATQAAIVAADKAVREIADAVLARNGLLMVTADHGNAEELVNLRDNLPDTEHSTNPVPLILVSKVLKEQKIELREGVLADVAPTILKYLGIEKPIEMTGQALY